MTTAGTFNMGQENADGDDLGNVCDPDTTVAFAQHRILRGLETSPEGWYADEAWGVANDSIGPVEQSRLVVRRQAVEPHTGGEHPTWMLEVGVKVPRRHAEPEARYRGSPAQRYDFILSPVLRDCVEVG